MLCKRSIERGGLDRPMFDKHCNCDCDACNCQCLVLYHRDHSKRLATQAQKLRADEFDSTKK